MIQRCLQNSVMIRLQLSLSGHSFLRLQVKSQTLYCAARGIQCLGEDEGEVAPDEDFFVLPMGGQRNYANSTLKRNIG